MGEKIGKELVGEMVLSHAKRIMTILLDNGYDLEAVKGSGMDSINIYIHRHDFGAFLEVCNIVTDVKFTKEVDL